MVIRKKWIIAPEGQSAGTHPATFGTIRARTWRGAWRLARRYGSRTRELWEVYGPEGKGDD